MRIILLTILLLGCGGPCNDAHADAETCDCKDEGSKRSGQECRLVCADNRLCQWVTP